MAKRKGKVAPDDDLLQDDDKGGGWKEHEAKAGEQTFDLSDDPASDVNDHSNNEDDKPDVTPDLEKKVAVAPKDDDEDLFAEDGADDDSDVSANADDEDLDEEDEEDEELEAGSEELGDDFLSPWEKKNYSKAMSGRVTRERRLKRDAEDESAAQSEKRVRAEDRADKAEKLALDLLTERVESDIELNKAEIVAAKEEGDNKAEVDAQTKLNENLIKKREIQRSADAVKPAAAAPATKDGAPATKQAPSPQLKRWVERNRWFTNAEFMDEEGYTRAIDAQLTKDPAFANRLGSPAYFSELDRRIHKKMPTLRGKIKKVFGTRSVQRTAPVERGSSSNGRSSSNQRNTNRVTLTQEDIANAAAYGITSPEELKEYARNKHNRELSERGSN
jgi:hypothetical protein